MKTNTLWLNLLIILSMSNHTVIQSENQKHSRMCRVYHFGYMHAQPFFTGAFAGSWLGFKLGNTLNFSPRAQTATSLFGKYPPISKIYVSVQHDDKTPTKKRG